MGRHKRDLSETQIENLIELVQELQLKLKRKNEYLTMSRHRLSNAKRNIKRLQGIISYQRERILKLYNHEVIDTNSQG
jgi:hypothetical protein